MHFSSEIKKCLFCMLEFMLNVVTYKEIFLIIYLLTVAIPVGKTIEMFCIIFTNVKTFQFTYHLRISMFHKFDRRILHGSSMFAVRAKIYGVLYNQVSSIAFDETSSYWSALKRS